MNQYYALLLTKNERFAGKTKERIPNPASLDVMRRTAGGKPKKREDEVGISTLLYKSRTAGG